MSYFSYKLYDGYVVNVADGYSFVSPWTDIKQMTTYSISVLFGGTPTGTLHLETSNESDVSNGQIIGTTSNEGVNALNAQPAFNGLDANTYPGSTQAITAAGTTTYDVALPGHRWVRVVYVASGGNATCSIWFASRG